MAKLFKTSRLSIKYDCGLDDDGRTIVRSKSYSEVKESATYEDIRAVVNGINSLVSSQDSELETLLVTSEYCL